MSFLDRFGEPPGSEIISTLIAITLILCIGVVTRLFVMRAPTTRHAVLFWSLVAVGLCPMMVVLMPQWRPSPRASQTREATTISDNGAEILPRLSPAITIVQQPQGFASPRLWLAAIWLMGAIVALVRIAHGLWMARRLMGSAWPLSAEEVALFHFRARPHLGGALPQLLVSKEAATPLAIGLARPCVLIPQHLLAQLSSDQLVPVIVHECAHAVRRDPLCGLYQRVLAALLWFHPLVHLVNRLLDEAREEICDNYALRVTAPADYARTMLSIAKLVRNRAIPLLAMPMFRLSSRLESRIANLFIPRRKTMTRLPLRTSSTIAVVMVCVTSLVSAVAVPPRKEAAKAANDDKLADVVPDGAGASATIFAGAGYDLSHKVDFQVGARQFLAGDDLSIDEIIGTSDIVTRGNIYIVKGRYRLASHQKAQLAVYVTTTEHVGIPTQKTQTIMVDEGEGQFSLIFYIWGDGWPHLSYYPAEGGNSFSSLYFGNGETLLTRGWWENDKENAPK